MSLTTLSYYASQAVQQLQAAPSTSLIPKAITGAVTENVVVHLKDGTDCFVFNVLGSPITVTKGIVAAQPATTASSGSSTTVTMTNTTGITVGMFVYGAGIPDGTTVSTVTPNTSIVLSNSVVTLINQNLLFSNGLPNFDGTTYRDDVSASFAGAPDHVMGLSSQFVNAPVDLGTAVAGSDRVTHVPPRPLGNTRNKTVFLRYDAGGNPLGIRWFWEDLIKGVSDAPSQYPS